jgi:hypothetical protein
MKTDKYSICDMFTGAIIEDNIYDWELAFKKQTKLYALNKPCFITINYGSTVFDRGVATNFCIGNKVKDHFGDTGHIMAQYDPNDDVVRYTVNGMTTISKITKVE